MSDPRIRRALLALLAGVAFAAGVDAGAGAGREPGSARPNVPPQVRAAVERFWDGYVRADGRVVRRDQGGDTVSEGQTYALLLSAAVGDRDRFARVWRWTRAHLQRADGTLAWRREERTAPQPAADADLDAARALALAARRFDRPRYAAAARRIGQGVLAHETARAVGTRVLVAGPWARRDVVVNPSYFAPRAYSALHALDHDPRWRLLRASSERLARRLTDRAPGLPPDWAKVLPWGVVPVARPGAAAAGSPAAPGPVYGYDAVRLPLRYAEACTPAQRALAARPWPTFHLQATLTGGAVPAVQRLDGRPLTAGSHPAALAGAAAAAKAAGDAGAAGRLLDRADVVAARAPTYYGTALAALARIALTTDLLGRCR
jgi:endoglucanase